MILAYIILIILSASFLFSLIKSIKNKKIEEFLPSLLLLPFIGFWWSSVLLGGSAFNNAQSEYDLYGNGHYYLESHNYFIEVTYNQFVYMKIIEIIGLICFGILILITIIKYFKNKKI